MSICWERLSRQLFTVLILNAALVVLAPLPFGVSGGMWNSIVSAPDHCLFVYFSQSIQAQGRRRLLKSGAAMGRRVPKARSGRVRERGFPLLRKAVDARYCVLCAISVYKFSQSCRCVRRNIPDNCYV